MTPIRSSTRRAPARRFSCAIDPRWGRFTRALAGAAAAAVGASLLLHSDWLPDVVTRGDADVLVAIAVLAAVLLVAIVAALWPARERADEVLRFDGASWWWERAGEPLAVLPEVFIDTEHWMLLRLRARDDAGRPVGHRARAWLPLSRRGLGSMWTPLRLHLFLA